MKTKTFIFIVTLCISASVSSATPYAIWCAGNTTLYFTADGNTYNVGDTYAGQTITRLWSGNSVISSPQYTPAWKSTVSSKLTHVVFDISFSNIKPLLTWYWFIDCSKLVSISGLKYLDTSEVTSMVYMFSGCSSLTSLDLSHFDTSKVTRMEQMFSKCSSLTSLDLSNFNTSKVTSMLSLFLECTSLTSVDISSFDISKVKDGSLGSIFSGCSSLTSIDVSNLDASKIKDTYSMFFNCSALKTIYCNDSWNSISYDNSRLMFYNCASLVGEWGATPDIPNFSDSSNKATPYETGYFTMTDETIIGHAANNYYWSTYYNSFKANIADNNTIVYIAKISENNQGIKTLSLIEIEDKIINAGQGVILRSTTSDIHLKRTMGESSFDYSNNILIGKDKLTPVSEVDMSGNIFTLGAKNGLGFYKYTGTSLSSRRAFFIYDDSNLSISRIMFEYDDVTPITSIDYTENSISIIYDIKGRKVGELSTSLENVNLERGLYIINGRKIFIK